VLSRSPFSAIAWFLLSLAGVACSGDAPSDLHPGPEPEDPYSDIRDVAAMRYAVSALGDVQGMKAAIVYKGDRVVEERYFNGAEPLSAYHMFSTTKSFTGALIGIAIDKGFIPGVEAPLSELLATAVDSVPEAWGRVTLENLLTMTAGHDFSYDRYGYLAFGPVSAILALPVTHEPGSTFVYSACSSFLLSVILTEATGMTALEFAELYLFGPLGWRPREWQETWEGYTMGSSQLYLSAQNMLEFGILYLNGGRLGELQLISGEWVAASTRSHIDTAPWWLEPWPYDYGYGYQWWVGRNHDHDHFSARGMAGQYIFVVPDLELVVVTICDVTGKDEAAVFVDQDRILETIIDSILPAVG
jgi:CubicO group peptidase (beta-lactamase class C family)